jgi:copper chaperone
LLKGKNANNLSGREEKMEKAVLRVEGMSCDHCVKTITKAAGDLPGVKNVAVDVKGGTVPVRRIL